MAVLTGGWGRGGAVEDNNHRRQCKMSSKKLTCKRTLRQVFICQIPRTSVSFETSFDSKQPKLVSALSETKRLFRLFHFCTETASFGVSIESKQTEDKPKQTETPIYFHQRHLRIFKLLTR
jgi:hypothetical protein